MGQLELLDAHLLRARWNFHSGKLELHAEGTLFFVTTGIRFEPLFSFKPGPIFTLKGWVDRTMPILELPYEHTQYFKFSRAPDFVWIRTARDPDGIPVPVERLDVTDPFQPSKNVSSAFSSGFTSSPLPEIKTEEETRFVLIGFPFDINVLANVDDEGSITMAHESVYLDLDTSGLQKGKLFWTFTPLRTGHTQVVVTIIDGKHITNRKIDIYVIYPAGPLPIDTPSNNLPIFSPLEAENSSTALVKAQANGASDEASKAELDMFGRYLESGIQYIQKNYAETHVFTLRGTTRSSRGVRIDSLSPYYMQFTALIDGKQTYVTIVSYDLGIWIHFFTHPIGPIGLTELNLPVNISAEQALARIISIPPLGDIKDLELRKREGAKENEYAFTFASGLSVVVEDTPEIAEQPVEKAQTAGQDSGLATNSAAAVPAPGGQLVGVAA